ncbi:hypothetical protein Lser_V15G20954 [Lactuca serriola]
MVGATHIRINNLLVVVFLLYVGQGEGYEGNRTRVVVPWVKRVRSQVSGCRGRRWVCEEGGYSYPSRVRRRCCDNRCVEVTSDVNNCGLCGIRCPFNWQCCRGVCVDTNINPFNCGQCFNRCPFFVFCTYGLCGYAGSTPLKPPILFPPNPPKPPRGPEQPEPPVIVEPPEFLMPPLYDAQPPQHDQPV